MAWKKAVLCCALLSFLVGMPLWADINWYLQSSSCRIRSGPPKSGTLYATWTDIGSFCSNNPIDDSATFTVGGQITNVTCPNQETITSYQSTVYGPCHLTFFAQQVWTTPDSCIPNNQYYFGFGNVFACP
jgi:hypothetical protein